MSFLIIQKDKLFVQLRQLQQAVCKIDIQFLIWNRMGSRGDLWTKHPQCHPFLLV